MDKQKNIALTRKNPLLAVILSLIFGVFGLFYLGWKYYVVGTVILIIFAIFLTIMNESFNIIMPNWFWFLSYIVIAHKAYEFCNKEKMISNVSLYETDKKKLSQIDIRSFKAIIALMSDLLHDLGISYAFIISLYVSILSFVDGNILKGVLFLLGTPIFMLLSSILFGFISVAIRKSILSSININKE